MSKPYPPYPVCPYCNVEHEVMVPLVHTNGTSAEELSAQLERAADAVRAAVEAVDAAAPQSRDYSFLPGGEWGIISDEHRWRMEKLQEVLGEVAEMRAHVAWAMRWKAERLETVKSQAGEREEKEKLERERTEDYGTEQRDEV